MRRAFLLSLLATPVALVREAEALESVSLNARNPTPPRTVRSAATATTRRTSQRRRATAQTAAGASAAAAPAR